MAQISAAMVKELRDKTGAGMMDCKKALAENDGDIEAAIDWLRTKGLAKAAKKSGRTAAEGLVGVSVDGPKGAIVEINSETDFVSRNDLFQDYVADVAGIAQAKDGDANTIKAAAYPGTERTVEEQLTHLIATIGENMAYRRSTGLSVTEGVVGSYVHAAVRPGTLGKIGVLVALEGQGDKATLEATAKHIAMHVAAANPAALSEKDLDPALVEREKEVQREAARASGKPENIIEKMIEGRMRKFYEEVCLLKQVSVVDGENRIETVAGEAGATVTAFVRYELGEGIEKEEGDFAAEVAAAVGG